MAETTDAGMIDIAVLNPLGAEEVQNIKIRKIKIRKQIKIRKISFDRFFAGLFCKGNGRFFWHSLLRALGTDGLEQRWALSVFFNFFTNKK